MSYPEQPGGQQGPVCENGHPMTTVDSSCPLCGAGHRPGEPAGGFPAAAGTQPGYPAPPAGHPDSPTQDGYQPGGYQPGGYQQGGYQQGGFAASPSGGYPPPPGSGYGSPAAGGYQASAGPGYWQQPGQPGQPVYAPAGKTNVFAIVSLVAGILWFFWLGSIVAVICGLVALGQTKARNEGGRGIAIAGVVLGAIGLVTLALFIIFGLVVAHTNSVQNTG